LQKKGNSYVSKSQYRFVGGFVGRDGLVGGAATKVGGENSTSRSEKHFTDYHHNTGYTCRGRQSV
jgi:hypothetical protein